MKAINRKKFSSALRQIEEGSVTLGGRPYCGISNHNITGLSTNLWQQKTYFTIPSRYYALMEGTGILGERTTIGELEMLYRVDLHANSNAQARAVDPERLAAVRAAVERTGTHLDPEELMEKFKA